MEIYSKKLLPISRECARCEKFGDLLCERCGETYCSQICQMKDWREHRRICMPMPRLLRRSEINTSLSVMPINRMLMEANGSYDATDANGSVSEMSAQGENAMMTQEQITKLTTTLKKMELDSQIEKKQVSGVNEVLSTPPATPKRTAKTPIVKMMMTDQNANVISNPAKVASKPASIVPSPPPAKLAHYKPSVQAIESRIHVRIVHVENHCTIFVIPKFALDEWNTLIIAINKHAKQAEHLKKAPEVGFILMAKPEGSETWARCLVKAIKTNDQIAKVEYMEYGITEVVKFADMKCLTEELVNAPRLVNKLTIMGIPEDMANADEVKQCLVTFQDNQNDFVIQDLLPIEKTNVCAHFNAALVEIGTFIPLSDTVKNLCAIKTAPETDKMNANELMEQDEPKEISNRREVEYKGFSGQNMELLILDNSLLEFGFFTAIQATDTAVLGTNDKRINEKASEIAAGIPFHPRDNETVLALSLEDNCWYRAIAQKKVDEQTYTLIYMDYGNMDNVTVDRIREMQEEFFFPCISSMCFIKGVSESNQLTPAVVARLQALLPPYSPVLFDSAENSGDEVMCTSNAILGKLKNEGLI